MSNGADTVSPGLRGKWDPLVASIARIPTDAAGTRSPKPRQGDCRIRVHAHDTEGCRGAGGHRCCSAPGDLIP